MGRGRGEDVATVEGACNGLEPVGGMRELDRLLDSAEPVGGHDEEPVVGPDIETPVGPAQGDRPAVAADTRVDDRQVDALRHEGNRAREHERPLDDAVRRDPVRDVDHLGVRGDALDASAADSHEVVLEAEVRQEGDEPAFDAASLTATTSPSRSWLSASATTRRPRPRASAEVTGPMETHGASTPSAAKARAAEADARTTRSASGKDSGTSSTVRYTGTKSAPSSRTSTPRAPHTTRKS